MLQRNPSHAGWRYELKAVCDGHMLSQARSWLHLDPEGFAVAYPPRIVNNLYFDTINYQNLNDNLAGISDRRKLRLRWYGELSSTIAVNPIFELKIKRAYLGDKRRKKVASELDLSEPYQQLLPMLFKNLDPDWWSRVKTMTQPTLINSYKREYFVSKDGAIRATLDYDQRVYDQRLAARPNLTRPTMLADLMVIEVKSPPELFKRLEVVMGNLPVLRSRSSKYVNGLLNSII